MHPLVAGLKAKLPADIQDSRRGLMVDEYMRVKGTQGTIFCLGDAAVTGATPQTALPPTAQVARQQGEYLASLLSLNELALMPATSAWPARSAWPASPADGENGGGDLVPLPHGAKPFRRAALRCAGDECPLERSCQLTSRGLRGAGQVLCGRCLSLPAASHHSCPASPRPPTHRPAATSTWAAWPTWAGTRA